MISEERKAARRFIARYLAAVISNMVGDDDVREEAEHGGIDPQEAIDAVSFWQDRLRKAGGSDE